MLNTQRYFLWAVTGFSHADYRQLRAKKTASPRFSVRGSNRLTGSIVDINVQQAAKVFFRFEMAGNCLGGNRIFLYNDEGMWPGLSVHRLRCQHTEVCRNAVQSIPEQGSDTFPDIPDAV